MKAYNEMQDRFSAKVNAFQKKNYEECEQRYSEAQKAYEESLTKLEAEMQKANGKARERTVDADQVIRSLVDYENELKITKKALEGTKVTVNFWNQKPAKAYKYRMMTTFFTARFEKGSWRFIEAYRSDMRDWRISAELSETAKKALISKYEMRW